MDVVKNLYSINIVGIGVQNDLDSHLKMAD